MPTTALTTTTVTDRNKNGAFFDALKSVPLGNSKYQIQKFVLSHQSDERNYRQAVLQLRQDIRALVGAQGHRRKEEVHMRRLERLIEDNQAILADKTKTEKEKFEAQCVIDESQADLDVVAFEMKDQEVLETDAIARIEAILEVFNALPSVTRKKFENSEEKYWGDRFIAEATAQLTATGQVSAGLVAALKQIGVDPVKRLSLQAHQITANLPAPKLVDSPQSK